MCSTGTHTLHLVVVDVFYWNPCPPPCGCGCVLLELIPSTLWLWMCSTGTHTLHLVVVVVFYRNPYPPPCGCGCVLLEPIPSTLWLWLCSAGTHTLHLVVVVVFYRKATPTSDEDPCSEVDEEENYANEGLLEPLNLTYPCPSLFIPPPSRDKVRKLAALFRGSSTKADALLKLQQKKGEPELVFMSDCKTRWLSLHNMLALYFKVVAMTNKLLTTELKLIGNLLNNRETNAVVE